MCMYKVGGRKCDGNLGGKRIHGCVKVREKGGLFSWKRSKGRSLPVILGGVRIGAACLGEVREGTMVLGGVKKTAACLGV
jgi:hypothetical protein